jgi:adenylate kinase
MRILLSFLGEPGSGKGTQAELLARDYSFFHLVTGDLIRAMIPKAMEGDSFAVGIKDLYEQGIPQPDHIMNQLVFSHIDLIDKSTKGIILDTYPLSMGQAKNIEEFYSLHPREYTKPVLVYFHIPEAESVERLLLRQSKEHRSDDQKEIITYRYREYAKRCLKLKNFFHRKNRFIEVDGRPPIEEIYQDLQNKLSRHHLLPQ